MAVSSLRSLRSGALAVLAAGTLALLVPAAMAMQSEWQVKPTPAGRSRPVLQDCNHRPVQGSIVHPGECVVVLAPGFAAAEQVRARLLSTGAHSSLTRADASGVVHYQLQIPRETATAFDVLTFVGLGAGNPATITGNVSVTVPRYAVLRYQIRN
ncbi:MAG: hypothetical protein M3Y42_16420 [Actinomycetota bacterium]|nr:hypothetical protein [Actinomycetota bacterium]MDQ2958531.1 hypothetical protein [Actinomycetota bacterium]